MSKKTLILLGIIGLFIIFLLCLWMHRRSIEEDVANCSQDILNKAHLSQLIVQTKNRGRDVLLSGTVESQQLKENALSLLQDQCHMTSLDNQIQVVEPKPTKNARIQILFNENNELVNFTGSTAKETIESKFGFILDSFKHADNFKLAITSDKEIIPTNYYRFTSTLKPYFNQINAANITFDGPKITLKGNVKNQQIKNQIANELQNKLGRDVIIVNLLTIEAKIEPRDIIAVQEPLDANHCQEDLSLLLEESKIHFNSGSATILDDSYTLLNHLAQTTRACQGVTISIIGHTDKSGNEKNNIILSKSRALAVANHLISQGVNRKKVTALGVGSSQPVATNETKQGRMQNRRIEFKVHSLEE